MMDNVLINITIPVYNRFFLTQKTIMNLKKISNKINYSLEKTFESCLSAKGNMLPFDFYLPDYNILIEYDGQQHYQIAFGQDEQKLFLQQENDKIKNNWCKKNNIKLIRISYRQKNITINDIIKGEQNIG